MDMPETQHFFVMLVKHNKGGSYEKDEYKICVFWARISDDVPGHRSQYGIGSRTCKAASGSDTVFYETGSGRPSAHQSGVRWQR